MTGTLEGRVLLLGIIGSIASSGFLVAALYRWVVAAQLYGWLAAARHSFSTLGQTLKGLNSLAFLSTLLVVIVFSFLLFSLDHPWGFALFPLILLNLCFVLFFATPPAVLLLSSSRRESLRLFTFIADGIIPYRTVALLEPEMLERHRHSPSRWFEFALSNQRILNPHDWKDVVAQMSANIPLVVIDTRVPSPAVIWETQRMLQMPWRQKAVFVLAEDGTAPSITAVSPNRVLTDLRKCRASGLVDNLRAMGLRGTLFHDYVPSRLSYWWNSKKLERAMLNVERLGSRYLDALTVAKRAYGRTEFCGGARDLLRLLSGNPSDGELEVLEHLSRDIAETETFLMRWKDVTRLEYIRLRHIVWEIHIQLLQLQRIVDRVAPVFLVHNEVVIQMVRRALHKTKLTRREDGTFDKGFGGGPDPRTVRCAGCDKKMVVITNMLVRRELLTRTQGCFRCGACGRYSCYECSDNRQVCRCGHHRWVSGTYISG